MDPLNKKDFIFEFFSLLLHPIFIPIYVTIVYINIFEGILNYDVKEYLFYVVLTGTFILPLITIVILKITKIISSFKVEKSNERIIPIISSGIYIYVSARLLMVGSVNSPLNSYLIGVVVTLSWILIFSRKLKISLHTASISSAMGFLIYLTNVFFVDVSDLVIIVIVLIGISSTSRIKLKAHSYKEIVLGIFFGFIPQIGSLILY